MISTKKTICLLLLLLLAAFAVIKGYGLWLWLLPFLFYLLFRRKINGYASMALYVIIMVLKKHRIAAPTHPDNEHSITLADGRKLAYALYGTTSGQPVFYFHGTPSSKLEPLLLDKQMLTDSGMSIVAPNRPGIGYSNLLPGRSISGFVNDVVALADHLGFASFSVMGVSGGAPYAAACAALIPARLLSVVIVSGAWHMNQDEVLKHIAPRNRTFWKVARKAPFFVPYVMKNMYSETEKPAEPDIETMKRFMPDADINFMCVGDRFITSQQALNEALRNLKGVSQDVILHTKQYDFDLYSIHFPITMFHGEKDRNTPASYAMKIAEKITSSTLFILEDEGHLSILGNYFEAIVQALSGNELVIHAKEKIPVEKEEVLPEQAMQTIKPDLNAGHPQP